MAGNLLRPEQDFPNASMCYEGLYMINIGRMAGIVSHF